MNLAVSNIAWHGTEDDEVLRVLVDEGVEQLEVAPTRLGGDPTLLSAQDVLAIRRSLEARGIRVTAMQSLLFGRSDLTLFGSDAGRDALFDYLSIMIRLANRLGASRLVFGSPKNRRLPADLDEGAAFRTATTFFRRIAEVAAAAETVFCVEPNPPQYDCDFVTSTADGIRLVDAVDHVGFGLHLDAAGATLAGDDLSASIISAGARIRHFHISAPWLSELETEVVDHSAAAKALHAIGYTGTSSIEMRPSDEGTNAPRVRAAIRLARSRYAAVSDRAGTARD